MATPTPITVFGVSYRSLNAAAIAFGRPANTAYKYIGANGVEPEAYFAASRTLVYLEFIGSDGRAYYRIPFEDGFFTTRAIVKRYRPDLLDTYDAANPTGEYRPFWGKGGDN